MGFLESAEEGSSVNVRSISKNILKLIILLIQAVVICKDVWLNSELCDQSVPGCTINVINCLRHGNECDRDGGLTAPGQSGLVCSSSAGFWCGCSVASQDVEENAVSQPTEHRVTL